MKERTKTLFTILAQFSTVISSIIGIVAIYIGVRQFNIAIKRADAQIEYIKEEASERQFQSRPHLIANVRAVKDVDSIGFFINIKNTGIRRPDSLVIDFYASELPGAVIKQDSLYYTYHSKFEIEGDFQNFDDDMVSGSFRRTKRSKYTIYVVVDYKDPILKTHDQDYHIFYLEPDMTIREVNDWAPSKKKQIIAQFDKMKFK